MAGLYEEWLVHVSHQPTALDLDQRELEVDNTNVNDSVNVPSRNKEQS